MTDTADVRPPTVNADEKSTLVIMLDYLRERMAAKLAGLTDEQARTPGVASGTSLIGLIQHLTTTELNWLEWSYLGEGDKLDSFAPVRDTDTVADALAAYRSAIERCGAIIAEHADLETPGVRSLRDDDIAPNLRWILLHLIEETARHAGHADILREHIDGVTGR